MANNTRRSALKVLTGAAAYAAGATTISAGAMLATSAQPAEAATRTGISPELARQIAAHDRARQIANEYEANVSEPARKRWVADEAQVPHIKVEGPSNYDGYSGGWTTAHNDRVCRARAEAKRRPRFHGPGSEDARAHYMAQRRLLAAVIRRERTCKRHPSWHAWSASYDEGERLDEIWYRAIDAVVKHPATTMVDVAGKIDFAAQHKLLDRDDVALNTYADVMRVQGRIADADRLVAREA